METGSPLGQQWQESERLKRSQPIGGAKMRRFFNGRPERRKSSRDPAGDLVVYYWTGGAPAPRGISNISVDGAHIQTPDQFLPGTLLTLILQSGSAPLAAGPQTGGPGAPHACRLQAAVVRCAQGGLGLQFQFGTRDQRTLFQGFLRHSIPLPKPENGSATETAPRSFRTGRFSRFPFRKV